MRLAFQFGERVAVLPAAITAHLHKASKKDIAILLTLAAEPVAQVDLSAAKNVIAAHGEYTAAEIDAALAFWRGTGVVSLDEDEQGAPVVAQTKADAPTAPQVIAEKGLPTYNTEELSGILARRKELSQLIDDCQQAFGKVFNISEINIIVAMTEYLGFDGEYVLLLLTHCRNMEIKSLRRVEKMAIKLHDDGILEARVLEEKLRNIEMMASMAGRVRAILGASSREMTPNEKAMFETWVCDMKFDEAVITRACEMAMDSNAKIPRLYANKVLVKWHEAGYRTIEEVDKALADYRAKKNGGSSFDVDEFFEAALRRTYN